MFLLLFIKLNEFFMLSVTLNKNKISNLPSDLSFLQTYFVFFELRYYFNANLSIYKLSNALTEQL